MEKGTETHNDESRVAADSLTFGQLKKIVAQKRIRPQELKLAFDYTERDDFENEIEDWHVYSHEPHLSSISETYRDEHGHQWMSLHKDERQRLINDAITALEQTDLVIRAKNSAILAYIAQGCYVETRNKQHQIELIYENNALLQHDYIIEGICSCLRSSITSFDTAAAAAIATSIDLEHVEDILQNLCTGLFFILEASRKIHGVGVVLRSMQASLISFFLEVLSRLCDDQDKHLPGLSVRQASLLLRQCILCALGGKDELVACKDFRRHQAQLPSKIDKLSIVTTPMDYSNFRMEIISKYPSYIPPSLTSEKPAEFETISVPQKEHHLELPMFTDGKWTATPAPSPPPSPKGKKSTFTTDQTLPFLLPLQDSKLNSIPTSIEEATTLFQSRQQTSVGLLELWQEQEHFVKSERGWMPKSESLSHSSDFEDDTMHCQARLREVERIYKDSLSHLQTCIAGLVSQIWTSSSHNLASAGLQADKEIDAKIEESVASTKNWLFNDKNGSIGSTEQDAKSAREKEDCRDMEILLKGITGSILLLLKWFRVSHILQFEYLSQVLIDADWIHTFHQAMMSLNPVVNVHVTHDDPRRSYFTVCNSLSEAQQDRFFEQDFDSEDEDQGQDEQEKKDVTQDIPNTISAKVNWKLFYNLINLLAITQKLVKKKIHRNHMLVQAKTWLHLRRPLRISHDLAQLYCLKLYKGQVPLCSRKWRMSNMKVITQIYMSCRPELREDWIAGTELDTDLEEAKQQEAAIRALILFFNSRRYPEQMNDLGFTPGNSDDSDDDFFGNEIAKMG